MAGARPPLGAEHYLATVDALRGESYAAVVMLGNAHDVVAYEYLGVVPTNALEEIARTRGAARLHATPRAGAAAALGTLLAAAGPVDLDTWEPDYGRKAEAQVKWEAVHGRPMTADAGTADSGAAA